MARIRTFALAALIVLASAAVLGAAAFYWVRVQRSRADLVLRGGRIITLDEGQPEPDALAARDGRIIAIGSAEAVRSHIGWWTRVIDLDDGYVAIPGFIEGHGHFAGLGESLAGVDLADTTSWEQVVERVAQAVAQAKPGQWIAGRGWHQEKWTAAPQPNVEGFPMHTSLDRVSPNNPVVLGHASGHASFVNAKAMELSHIDRTTPDPEGGQILKDADGEPTGVLRETASSLVRRGAGEPSLTSTEAVARIRRMLALADREALSNGITSFQDAGTTLDVVERMKRMIDEGALQTRLWVMLEADEGLPAAGLDRARTLGYGDHHLTVRAIKWTMDGALGSRGAWLLEPYTDLRDTVGLPRSVDVLRQTAHLAVTHGYQMAVHAIGDRANREVLNVYEDIFRTNGRNGADPRWRIEHAQHLSDADIPRFGRLGVIASMQPVHATSDAVFVSARLGDRRAAEGAYVWRKLIQAGAIVTSGTDAPVESVDPIANYHAAVTRRVGDGSVFYGDQKMSRMEALRSYTVQNAFAAFEDHIKGTLAVGKLADVTVLTRDITTVPEDEIRRARVAYTIIGGKVVYESDVR